MQKIWTMLYISMLHILTMLINITFDKSVMNDIYLPENFELKSNGHQSVYMYYVYYELDCSTFYMVEMS